MANIEIDGVELQAEDGKMVIQVADEAGIPIPRFCYHSKLSVVANCRMCLVEIEKAPKPMPACATPVKDGMKIYTKSPTAIDAQKGTMEFLLINHPLDCPICDQGGECELQDLALEYGGDLSRFHEKKRAVKDKNLGPLIMTDMTRCIHCTRCVRFGEEVAGLKELGATGRGEHMEIGTYVERSVTHEMSGNVIDLCPVGALTSKPFRFRARAWELINHPSVAPHDAVGSNIQVQTVRGRAMRVVPSENEAVNEVWISDRDRFSYEGLYAEDRLRAPMIKRETGQWQEVDWETALETTVSGITRVVENHGAAQLGALASPTATLEELYLLQQLARGLGSGNIDHRLRRTDFTAQEDEPAYPWLGRSLEDLEHIDALLVIGSNIRKSQPLIGHRIRKAALRGGQMMFINPVDFPFLFPVSHSRIALPSRLVGELAAVTRAALDAAGQSAPESVRSLVEAAQVGESHRAMAAALREGERAGVLVGEIAQAHPAASALHALAVTLAAASGASPGWVPAAANTVGACVAGALPHRGPGGEATSEPGLHTRAMLEQPRRAYVLLGIEPEHDCAQPVQALEAMRAAEFVVQLTPYASERIKEYADVLLPVGPYAETAGTFVNAEGRWQSFGGAVRPYGETRPAWKVLRVLGNLFGLSGFDYVSAEQVRDELDARVDRAARPDLTRAPGEVATTPVGGGVERIGETPLYSVDALVRRAESLQATEDGREARQARIHPALAERLGVAEGDQVRVRQGTGEAVVSVGVTERVPEDAVWLATGLSETAGLDEAFASVSVERA